MRNRPEDVLARFKAGVVKQPGDDDLICKALEHQIARPVFMPLDWDEWKIGRIAYPNWRGFEYIHRLLSHPGKIHVCDLTHQPNIENSRKAVQKAIAIALGKLESTQPDIGVHLKANITTGEYCSYDGNWSNLNAYHDCVQTALGDLQAAGVINAQESARLLSSALRAFNTG